MGGHVGSALFVRFEYALCANFGFPLNMLDWQKKWLRVVGPEASLGHQGCGLLQSFKGRVDEVVQTLLDMESCL